MPDSLAVRGTLNIAVDELNTSGVERAEFRKYLVESAVQLSTLREALRGAKGEIIDEFGDTHELSLAEWADHPPETLLTIYFTYQQTDAPTGFRGSAYPPDVLDLLRAPLAEPSLWSRVHSPRDFCSWAGGARRVVNVDLR